MSSYLDIPDAPWIREMETTGGEEPETIYCPVCGEEDPEQFFVADGEVLGCDCCVKRVDAYKWHCKKSA